VGAFLLRVQRGEGENHLSAHPDHDTPKLNAKRQRDRATHRGMGEDQSKDDAGGNDPQQKGFARLNAKQFPKGTFLHVNYLPFISNSCIVPDIKH